MRANVIFLPRSKCHTPGPITSCVLLFQALLLAEHLSGDATVKLIIQAKSAFDIAFVTVLVAGTAIMLLMAAVIAQIISRAKTPEPSASPGGATTTASDAATP
jgi:putative effector of murein hydrolase LrgA (UPF0299 family)